MEALRIFQHIIFWVFVFGATGLNYTYTSEKRGLFGEKTTNYLKIGNADPLIRILMAIMALIFRPW